MSARPCRLICLLLCLLFAGLAFAQEGHPVKGTWVGDWSPTPAERNHLVVFMDYDGKTITGVVNPGPNAIPITLARLDITPGGPQPERGGPPPALPVFKVHIEAAAKDAKGAPLKIVADGTIQNLALPNRAIAGVWSQTSGGNTVQGRFNIHRQ